MRVRRAVTGRERHDLRGRTAGVSESRPRANGFPSTRGTTSLQRARSRCVRQRTQPAATACNDRGGRYPPSRIRRKIDPVNTASTLARHPDQPSGWRRACVVSVFALLALLQVFAPLLHTHVSAATGTTETGIHLPLALVHAGHAHTGVEMVCGDADDAAAITAPPELRREERLAARLPVALVRPREFAPPPSVDVPRGDASTDRPVDAARVLRPPSRGPPASA